MEGKKITEIIKKNVCVYCKCINFPKCTHGNPENTKCRNCIDFSTLKHVAINDKHGFSDLGYSYCQLHLLWVKDVIKDDGDILMPNSNNRLYCATHNFWYNYIDLVCNECWKTEESSICEYCWIIGEDNE